MKSKPVVTRHQADDDIDHAFEHYLSEGGPELAVAFVDAYESATSHLSRFPLSGSPRLGHTLVISDLRQWPLRRFPYMILYFDREHSVEIWRVLHGHVVSLHGCGAKNNNDRTKQDHRWNAGIPAGEDCGTV